MMLEALVFTVVHARLIIIDDGVLLTRVLVGTVLYSSFFVSRSLRKHTT